MTHRDTKGVTGSAKHLALAGAAFFIGCVVVLWSWNTLAVELFQMPEARFKHAVAFASVFIVLAMAGRRIGGRTWRPGS